MSIATPNGFQLDNSGKRVVVDPITRIEGHLRIEVNVDKDNVIRNAVSTGTMWGCWRPAASLISRAKRSAGTPAARATWYSPPVETSRLQPSSAASRAMAVHRNAYVAKFTPTPNAATASRQRARRCASS